MLKLLNFIALIFYAAGALAQPGAPISSVTLYPGSATVERTAQISPGMNRLEIGNLPANFDTQTLRAHADPGIHIGQIVIQDQARSEAVNPRESEIEGKIEALQDQAAALDAEAQAATLLKNYLENFGRVAATDKQHPYIDAKSMKEIVEALRGGAQDSFAKLHRIQIQKREIDRKIDTLQRDLNKLRSGAKDLRTIIVHLAAERAGTLKLSYQVNGTGWKPTYRAELDSASSSVRLERHATVSQKTGEDWNGVKLRLSTGQPRLSPAAPEPQPWLLTYRPPTPARALGEVAAASPAPLAQYKMMAKRDDVSDNYIPPVIETHGQFATEFEVPTRANVPADGREISVALSKIAFPVKQRIRIAPRMDKSGVVTAEAERPEGVWISGPIQLFRDGNYVGGTYWNTQLSQQLVLPFGRDDLIRVAVDRAKTESNTSGFISQRSERRVAELYTVTSFHKSPVDVLLLESSPVSTSDEIKVEAQYDPRPGIEKWEERQGVVGWEKTLAPKESWKIKLDYTISYPKEGAVIGLP